MSHAGGILAHMPFVTCWHRGVHIQAPHAAGELVTAGIESRVAAASAVAAVCSEMATCTDHDGGLCCPPQHLASDAVRALLTALQDYTVDNRCSFSPTFLLLCVCAPVHMQSMLSPDTRA